MLAFSFDRNVLRAHRLTPLSQNDGDTEISVRPSGPVAFLNEAQQRSDVDSRNTRVEVFSSRL